MSGDPIPVNLPWGWPPFTSDWNSDRIATALERIAAALEKANEGVTLATVEETEDSGRGVFPLGDHGKDW